MHRAFIAAAIGAVVVLGAWGAARSIPTGAMVPSEAPRIEVRPWSVDFGNIDQAGGIVSAEVEVFNRGIKPLEIHRLSTSCGCTTADMDLSSLAPGASRTLTIRFDPMAHPDQYGPIERVVYVQTSDPENPEVEIDVVGNVIPAEETL